MPDGMDDLLQGIPSNPMPPELPQRVLVELRAARSVERRRRRVLDLALMGIFAVGVAVIWPVVAGLESLAPRWQAASALEWGSMALESPAQSIWTTLLDGVDWSSRAAQVTGPFGLLGLVLLAAPLFMWLVRLMPAVGEGATT